MDRLNFSGHESFYCRALWIPKGYHFIKEGKQFNEGAAVADLGVGRNMVSSIKFWLEAFNICDTKQELTRFANFIFGTEGVDLYLEDPATLWLLHYFPERTGIHKDSFFQPPQDESFKPLWQTCEEFMAKEELKNG